MADLKLKTVTRTQGNNKALKDGTVKPKTFDFVFEEVDPLIHAFRRMVRGLEFDVCEMAITTYMCARAHGKRFLGIPIFLVREFHHGAIVYNTKVGIRSPKDLEGRKVGVKRGYTVTTGVWARSILQHEHGVNLDKVTWVLSGDEHVQEYRAPSNVVPIEKGKTLEDMLVAGEIAAAIGVSVDHPDVKPLIADAREAGYAALKARGHYPINHTVVVKDEVLAAHPEVAADLFNTFAEAKRLYVERLKTGESAEPNKTEQLHRRVMDITGGDPLPYGIAPNRKMLEAIIQYATEQHILLRPFSVEDLFAPSTLDLIG